MSEDTTIFRELAPELMPERVLILNPKMVALGIVEAHLVQQLSWKLAQVRKSHAERRKALAAGHKDYPQYGMVDQDGNAWVYITTKEWASDFNNAREINRKRIYRVFKWLEELGIVMTRVTVDTRSFPARKFKWYSLDGEKLHNWLTENQIDASDDSDDDAPADTR